MDTRVDMVACMEQQESSALSSDSSMKHFVLIHGLGHGAWCWYKVTPALRAAGHTVTALDLTSNGDNNKASADNISDIAQFVQPLTDFLASYDDGKVILVGHSLGGSVISFAMEAYSERVEKAVFVAAFMPTNGQTLVPLRMFVAFSSLILKRILIFKFGNSIFLPSSVSINLDSAQVNFYDRSPPEDVNLALARLNASPFRPLLRKLVLTEARYGSIPRIYIKATDDKIIPASYQSSFVDRNPPAQVLTVPESDHSPFFSQPAALVDLLISIATRI
ncbi:hypothetical protein L7F22_053596 [Adiantum nelumboides]|nr:hypothetical protein [Adiantum nelumboides]